MSDYTIMELSDLEKLQKEYQSQIYNAKNTLEEITRAIYIKKVNADDRTIKLNPYYKDKRDVIKVTINNNSSFKYEITRIRYIGPSTCIHRFSSQDLDFLKYYKMCSKLDWQHAIDQLNVWLKGDLLITNYE